MNRWRGLHWSLYDIPTEDPLVYDMICQADTVGVFQIESRAQQSMLPRLKPREFYDLVIEVAIVRPGPIQGGMVHPYLKKREQKARDGTVQATPYPKLDAALARTLGVPIFQEQLLRLAMVAAGFSGGEAEELRRAMGMKRSVERMNRIEARLREGMTARGIVGEAQEEVVRGITSFALYGFPESHSASFALIAYASAYLRAHHPAAFLAGLLNAYPMGFYNPATLVKDAQRHGVEVRPIEVAASHWKCTLERGAGGPAVRIGLRYAAGLRSETGRTIEVERSRAGFESAADLARRVALRRDELDALAEVGALGSIEPAARERRSALWQVAAVERDRSSLFAGISPPAEPSPLEELSPLEATLADYRTSGLTTGPHLLAHLRPELRRRGILAAEQLRAAPDGRFVRTAGHAIVRQRPRAAKGFCFLTLEDETGTSNAVLTPDAFRKFRVALHLSPLVEVAGPLQNLEGVIHIRVQELRPLAPDGPLPQSHDYR
jgi:error-prone DNA polymerase